MMKDQYLPHDAGAMGNGKIMELIAEYGMEGYGIYWMIMEHLRQQNGYKSNMTRMKILAGKAGISIIKLKNVLCDFELFIIEDEQIYSPGLSKRMKPLDEKRAKCKANGSKGGKANALKINNGNSSDAKAVKESKERKVSNNIIRDDNPPTAAAVVGIKGNWEKCIDDLVHEQVWCELMAMRSGLQKDFVKYYPEIIRTFKDHIRCYGKEASIFTLSDAKNYFSNYIVPGSITHNRLLEKLGKIKAKDPYRFEERNAKGERSYCGMKIPKDAPPRPNANAFWGGKNWE